MISPYFKIINLVFALIFSFGYCQQFGTPENPSNSDGTISEYLINTISSPDGYLYLATKNGILKYDGYRFINVLNTKAILSQLQIKDFLIYYHNTDGLFQLNVKTEKATALVPNHATDSNPNNDHFENIFMDSKGRIWGTDFNYVKYYAPKQKEVKTFLIDPENKNLNRWSIIETTEGKIWAISEKGFWVYDEANGKMKPFPNLEISGLKYTAAFGFNNKVFLATESGQLMEINPINGQVKNWKITSEIGRIEGFFSSEKGLFLFTSKRIYSFKNGSFTEIYSAGKNKINSVNYDEPTGNIWIASEKGLVKIPEINPAIETLNFPIKDSLENNVISIVERADKSIWTLTGSGTVWKYQNNQWTLQFKNPLNKNYVLNEVGGALILSTNKGLFIWKGENFENIPIKNLKDEGKIIKVLKVSENEVWIVYSQEKIQRYFWPNFEPLPDKFSNDENFWKDNQWNDIVVDKKDQIWLAGWMPKGFGINRYDPVKHFFKDISDEKSNPESIFVGDYYNKIGLTKGSNLLFSAYGGFNEVNESGKVISKIDVLSYPISDAHIEGISADAAGNVYFATGNGLQIYRKNLDKIARITAMEGLPTDNLLNAYTPLSNEKVAIGVENGIVLINPSEILNSQLQNKLSLSQLKINGILQNSYNNNIELSEKQTDLTLYFSNLSFLDPAKVNYEYRFEGDSKWQQLGQEPELSLNHISPGKYRIHIRTQDNLYNTQEKTLEISILANPPFFKSNLFYVLLLVFIVILVVLIQKYLSKRKQKEANYIQKIKETEMQMLRAQMNPHFMFNTLNSINSYIIQNKTEDASIYLTTFSKLMRNILHNSKEQFITLENELQTLRLYIELESARLEHSFSYKIDVKGPIFETDIFVPPLIIQPFVENAIWHGLRNKSGAGTLSIIVYVNGANQLKIYVEDNGVGREKSAKLKTNQVSHKSYGMDITRDRLKMLDEDNTIEIEDLYDSEKNAIGTIVIITLKISEND